MGETRQASRALVYVDKGRLVKEVTTIYFQPTITIDLDDLRSKKRQMAAFFGDEDEHHVLFDFEAEL